MDYTAHLGTIHADTQLSQSARHLNMGSGECEQSHQVTGMRVSVTVHIKIVLKRNRHPVDFTKIQGTHLKQVLPGVLLKNDSSFGFKIPGRMMCC